MKFRTLLLTAIALCLLACGDAEPAPPSPPANPYEAAAQMAEKQMESLQAGNRREILEPATLKGMLPATLAGLTRKSISSNGMGAAGFRMATANATYQNEGEPRRITVTITDGMGGDNIPGMGLVNSFTMDREEGTRTTKTITVGGRKAIREYDSARGTGSLAVVFDQSVVQLEGRGLEDVDDLERVFGALSLSDL